MGGITNKFKKKGFRVYLYGSHACVDKYPTTVRGV